MIDPERQAMAEAAFMQLIEAGKKNFYILHIGPLVVHLRKSYKSAFIHPFQFEIVNLSNK